MAAECCPEQLLSGDKWKLLFRIYSNLPKLWAASIKTCVIHHAAAQGKADLSPLNHSVFTILQYYHQMTALLAHSNTFHCEGHDRTAGWPSRLSLYPLQIGSVASPDRTTPVCFCTVRPVDADIQPSAVEARYLLVTINKSGVRNSFSPRKMSGLLMRKWKSYGILHPCTSSLQCRL